MEKHLRLIIVIMVLFAASCSEKKSIGKNEMVEKTVSFTANEISIAQQKAALDSLGFQTFNYINPVTQDTVLMQQYFIAFLKSGPERSQNKQQSDSLQALHLEHLQRMYDLGYADISGPFGDNGAIRGITIYNVPTFKIADSLANLDPMVKAGRLVIEVRPWWAGKGLPLR